MAAASPEAVLAAYGELINTHRFDAIAPLIAEDASFWFSDGSYVGIASIRAAFEATWARLVDESYWLEDLHWLARDACLAVCTYRFGWKAIVDGVPQSGAGRGTSIVQCRAQKWVIVHEHLSVRP